MVPQLDDNEEYLERKVVEPHFTETDLARLRADRAKDQFMTTARSTPTDPERLAEAICYLRASVQKAH